MKSFLSYMGGKSRLAGKIVPLMPEHECYCEVFAGAAWVLFRKEPAAVEIINDINSDLVTLYRVVKYHLDEFVRYFRWALVARDEFERLKRESPDTLTDIQRAARFYYLLKIRFSSHLVNPTFGVAATARPNLNLLRIEEELSAAHLRLAHVYVENLPYQKIIPRFDRSGTLFYVDPPYHGFEDYYGKGIFAREDFETLRDLLAAIKGQFMMSINDTREIRKIFAGFRIQVVETTYTASATSNRKRVGELLITNYDPEKEASHRRRSTTS